MSFSDVNTNNLNTNTINWLSYPPPISATTIPLNDIVSSTGNTTAPFVKDSGIQAYKSAGSTIIDMNPSLPLHTGLTYDPSVPAFGIATNANMTIGIQGASGGQTFNVINRAANGTTNFGSTGLGSTSNYTGGSTRTGWTVGQTQASFKDLASSTGTAGQVITADGVGNCSWQTGGGGALLSQIIPWTSWNFFVLGGSLGGYYWNTADAQNGSGFAGTPNRDYGSASFVAPINGNYQFTFAFLMGNNVGIATFTINGVVTTIDTYNSGNPVGSFVWTQALTPGTYTVDLSSFTKNGSSSNYWLLPLMGGLLIQAIAIGP